MDVTLVQKKLRLPVSELVKFHVLVELSLRHEPIIASDLAMLALLVEQGEQSLPGFCQAAARVLNPNCPESQLATRAQNVRNRLVKLEKRGIVVRSRPGNKTHIMGASYLRILLDKPIMLDYKFLSKSDSE